MAIWDCKIGEIDRNLLSAGCDAPLRQAVQEAYKKLTGRNCDFCFSGWGGQLDKYERAVVDNDETQIMEEGNDPQG